MEARDGRPDFYQTIGDLTQQSLNTLIYTPPPPRRIHPSLKKEKLKGKTRRYGRST